MRIRRRRRMVWFLVARSLSVTYCVDKDGEACPSGLLCAGQCGAMGCEVQSHVEGAERQMIAELRPANQVTGGRGPPNGWHGRLHKKLPSVCLIFVRRRIGGHRRCCEFAVKLLGCYTRHLVFRSWKVPVFFPCPYPPPGSTTRSNRGFHNLVQTSCSVTSRNLPLGS